MVPTDEIVMAARREIARRQGLTTFGKAVSATLKHPNLMKWGATGRRRLLLMLFKKVPKQSGLRLRFPAPFIAPDRTLPEFPSEALSGAASRVHPRGGGKTAGRLFYRLHDQLRLSADRRGAAEGSEIHGD